MIPVSFVLESVYRGAQNESLHKNQLNGYFVSVFCVMRRGTGYSRCPHDNGSKQFSHCYFSSAKALIGSPIPCEKVYFVKVDEGKGPYDRKHVIMSDYSKDGRAYLLNVEPGRYAAIGFGYSMSVGSAPSAPAQRGLSITITPAKTSNKNIFFPMDVIESTVVDVYGGEFVFMGDYL